MIDPARAKRSPVVRFIRRTAAVLVLGFVFFTVLWMTVLNAVTAALVASGGAVVLVAGASASETFLSILEAIAEAVLGFFGAIAEFFSSILD